MGYQGLLFVVVVVLQVVAITGSLPVSELSMRYRNWTYYNGSFGGFVVPPWAGNFSGQTLTDTAIVFEKTAEDTLPGQFRMTYLFYNGTKGGNGYEAALATSDDLLNWKFGLGGDKGNDIVALLSWFNAQCRTHLSTKQHAWRL